MGGHDCVSMGQSVRCTPTPFPSSSKAAPGPEWWAPGPWKGLDPRPVRKTGKGRPAQGFPASRCTLSGPDASGLVAPLPHLPAGEPVPSIQPSPARLRDWGLLAGYLAPKRGSYGNGGTVDSGSNPQQQPLLRTVLGWRGRGWGDEAKPPSPYGNSERTSLLRPAPALCKNAASFLLLVHGCFRRQGGLGKH